MRIPTTSRAGGRALVQLTSVRTRRLGRQISEGGRVADSRFGRRSVQITGCMDMQVVPIAYIHTVNISMLYFQLLSGACVVAILIVEA